GGQPFGAGRFEVSREVICVVRAVAVPIRAARDVPIGVVHLSGGTATRAGGATDTSTPDHAERRRKSVVAGYALWIRDGRNRIWRGVYKCVPLRASGVLGSDRPPLCVVFVCRETCAVFVDDSSQRIRQRSVLRVLLLVVDELAYPTIRKCD